MNTLAMQNTELLGDAELVGLCLGGNRDAFERITMTRLPVTFGRPCVRKR
jgi:hypothetical protein